MSPRSSSLRDTCATGFTLVELVVVIVITGVIAGVIGAFFKPAIDSYFGSRRRAELTDVADSALRRMARDIRLAVPNSIRPNSTCGTSGGSFELVPTSGGGRYRLAPDPGWDAANPANPSAPIDGTTAVSSFDVLALSPSLSLPSVNDWVVIDNQNTDDVYTSAPNLLNRASILGITTYTSTSTPNTTVASHRISLTPNSAFPSGYREGRFSIVPSNQQAVFYVCSNAGGTSGQGDGTGTLYRFANYGFNSSSTCPDPLASVPAVVATNVLTCQFEYSPSSGATQNGFMWMQIQLQQAGERVTLSYGTHVDNVP